ncbi:MAG: hypothetical protein ABI678_32215, partial [Kofleriaceae bacterium]
MIRSVLLVVALAGCDVLWNIDKVPDTVLRDALSGDTSGLADANCAAGETPIGGYGFAGTGLFHVCAPPSAAVILSEDINTDAASGTPCVAMFQGNN